MNVNAIIYKTQSGHTKRYAQMLSEMTGIPAYSTREAVTAVRRGGSVLFMGWIRLRDVMGYSLLLKLYDIKAVTVVGAASPDFSNIVTDRIRRKYRIDDKTPVFYLQGGFNQKDPRGMDRKLVGAMVDDLGKKIRKNRRKGITMSGYEENLLHVIVNGGDFVSRENLDEIRNWISED